MQGVSQLFLWKASEYYCELGRSFYHCDNSVVVAQKQPWTKCTQMRVEVFWKSFIMDTDFWISYNIYMSWNIILFSIFLNHLKMFSSVTQVCPTLCNPMGCSTPGFPVYQQLPELTQTHVHRVGDAIQPSHPLSSPSPPIFNLAHHQGLFKWVSSLHQVAKILELQHQSFQRTFRTDFL